jgi:HEAT repeat protein
MIMCLVFFGPAVFAQENTDDESKGEATVEELYLQSVEMAVIREQAVTIDRGMKLQALDNMAELIESGKINEDSADALYLLDYLAMEGIAREVRVNGRLVNFFPEVRRRACELLGQVGGETATNTLLDVFDKETEPMVLAEAAYAMGKIGNTKNGDVVALLAHKIHHYNVVKPDDNFAFAVLLAFEKIAKANNGIEDPAVYEAVIEIANGNYIRDVRQKAYQVLASLRKY